MLGFCFTSNWLRNCVRINKTVNCFSQVMTFVHSKTALRMGQYKVSQDGHLVWIAILGEKVKENVPKHLIINFSS